MFNTQKIITSNFYLTPIKTNHTSIPNYKSNPNYSPVSILKPILNTWT